MVPGADHDSEIATHITFGRTVRRHNHPAARPGNTQLASPLPLVASVAAGRGWLVPEQAWAQAYSRKSGKDLK